jgi:hypothetical protein
VTARPNRKEYLMSVEETRFDALDDEALEQYLTRVSD